MVLFHRLRVPLVWMNLEKALEVIDKKAKRVKDIGKYMKRYSDFMLQVMTAVEVTAVNAAAVDFFGLASADEPGQTFNQGFLPETRDFFRDSFLALIGGEIVPSREVPIMDSFGSTKFVSASFVPTDQASSGGDCILACIDVTGERFLRDRMAGRNDIYKRVIDNAPDAIVVSDENRNIVYASKKTLTTFQFHSSDELVGKSLLAWIDRNQLLTAIDNIKKVYEGESNSNRYTLIDARGRTFSAEIHSAVVPAEGGKHKNMISIIREVADLS